MVSPPTPNQDSLASSRQCLVAELLRRASDTTSREISRNEPEDFLEVCEVPDKAPPENVTARAIQEVPATITTMSGNQTTALALQKERLVAALRPALVGTPVSLSPTLLSQLRPLSFPSETKWTHGFSRLDGSGRVRDAFLFRELGWSPGDRLLLAIDGERLIIRREACGNATLDPRGRVTLGEAARRVLHLEDGDGVLLSGDLTEGLLVIHPAQRCDEVVNV